MAISLEDVQNQVPTLHVSLSRVGVTNVEKVIRIAAGGTETLFSAKLDCFVDLGPAPEGRAHVALRGGRQRRDRRGDPRRERASGPRRSPSTSPRRSATARARAAPRCALEARYPEHKPAPHSGIATQEIYTLHGVAVASAAGTRRLIGVTAQGMTACPCAQTLVQARVARAARRGRLRRRRDRAHLRGGPRRHAQPARPRHAAHRLPRGLRRPTSTPSGCSRSSRTRCRRRSTS